MNSTKLSESKRLSWVAWALGALGVVALAAALGAPDVIAAPPGGPGPGARMGMRQRVVVGALASLDLTQDQKDKIKAVIESERSSMQTMAAQNRADALALRDLAQAPQPDPKAIGEAFLKVRQNRQSMKAARDEVQAKIEAFLTPAQKAKFQGYLQAAKDAGRAVRGRFGGRPAGL